ncbi:MAG: T9SS type A sorting domain-containing protein [Dyadobacter sp.]
MKKIIRISYLTIIMIAFVCLSNISSFGQNLSVLAEYQPAAFTGYPMNGNFQIILNKSGSEIPANNFRLIISIPPQVAWTLDPFTVPSGFTVSPSSTATSLVILQTGNYVGSGIPARREFIIPVKATGSIATGSTNNYTVSIQKDGFGYDDTNPSDDDAGARVTVASNPLPVTLAAFNVTREGQTALLSWSTTSEANSDRFDIEHSLNAKNWNLLSSVNSKGESSILEKYSYIDTDPSEGENFYRLKMIDRDGTFAYSRIQSITFDGTLDKSMIYPNPASDYLKLNVSDLRKIKSVKIYDLNGRAVYTASGNGLTKTIDIKKVSTGLYVVEVVNVNGEINTSKVSIFK